MEVRNESLFDEFIGELVTKEGFQGHLSHGYQTPTKKYDSFLA